MPERFDDTTLRQLERLRLPVLRAILAGVTGDVQGPASRPQSEFADYRPYVAGDDLRRIDWNVYRRLRQLVVKVGEEEGRLAVDLLLDTSRSMCTGEPQKLAYAKRLVAVLGAVGVLAGHRVQVVELADGRSRLLRTLEGARALQALVDQLDGIEPGRTTALHHAALDYRKAPSRCDLAVLVTDANVPADELADALRAIHGSTPRCGLLHVLAPDELEVDAQGSVALVDAETGERVELVLDEETVVRYRTLQHRFLVDVERAARARSFAYSRAVTDVPPLDVLLGAAGDPLVMAP